MGHLQLVFANIFRPHFYVPGSNGAAIHAERSLCGGQPMTARMPYQDIQRSGAGCQRRFMETSDISCNAPTGTSRLIACGSAILVPTGARRTQAVAGNQNSRFTSPTNVRLRYRGLRPPASIPAGKVYISRTGLAHRKSCRHGSCRAT